MSSVGPHAERISLLIEIDQHDRALAELRAARAEIKSAHQSERDRLLRLKAEWEALLHKQKALDREQKNREVELEKTERKLARVSSFEHVTTARELEAAKHEVEVLKRKKSELEDAILLGLEQQDAYAAEKVRLERTLKEARAAYDREKEPRRARFDKLSAEIETHRAGRADCLKRMDPELKALYEPLIRRYGDRAVTTVVDNRCLPCRLHVPAQHVVDVLLGKALHRCQHCERLILPEENPER